MDYIEVRFVFSVEEEFLSDLLTDNLARIGFDMFTNEGSALLAYCPVCSFNEDDLKQLLTHFEYAKDIQYSVQIIKAKNWNENWEKNFFDPIAIGKDCIICSSFHKDLPEATYKIMIDPKMSFGTGHHETTALMVEQLLKIDLQGKSFLDMGCGTAVLAILAAKKGAMPIVGIDIDEWAYENSLENIQNNHTEDIQIYLGGAELLVEKQFDVIFANINRNILLADMASYAACLHSGSELYISGFYVDDMPILKEEAEKNELQYISFEQKNNWATIRFVKK
jgi:ribosomal protein L11 methyltransferase